MGSTLQSDQVRDILGTPYKGISGGMRIDIPLAAPLAATLAAPYNVAIATREGSVVFYEWEEISEVEFEALWCCVVSCVKR